MMTRRVTADHDKLVDGVIYRRISRDPEGLELGVDRQEADCRALASQIGVRVVHVYTDDDTGASTRSTKRRDDYPLMIDAAREGKFRVILAYSNSRLTRRPREVEDLIELHERHGVRLHTVVSGDDDLATADGRMVARIKGNVDAAEAERTGERVARAFEQRAEKGLPHGAPAYGWTRLPRVPGAPALPDVPDPETAPLIREAAHRVVEGESLRAIFTDWNGRGLRTPRGEKWDGTMLRQILLRERNCGRLIRKGAVVGPGNWEPIIDEGTHDRVVAILTNPSRRTSRGNELQHYLSGLVRCGRCGAPMRMAVGRVVTLTNGHTKRQPPAYWCNTCFKVKRKAEDVEETIEAVVIARLSLPDGPDLLGGQPAVVREQRGRAQALTARLDLAADDYAEGTLTREQLKRITAKLRPQIEDAERRAREAEPARRFEKFVTLGVRTAWESASPEEKRELVDTLMSVRIMPAGQGKAFNPELIEISWKGEE